ncbi:hypothetical protein (plasmid) [Streptomyces leeuwenhoekii]|uniref:Uncharacterized protein n=1 Tax=Streptomyces leeuwenhoekii TaxID=1437453 RepID=A0A0F7VL80_STRLW|nr:hypothetical protein [Streptomyces leeuwenhoekii]
MLRHNHISTTHHEIRPEPTSTASNAHQRTTSPTVHHR